MINAAGIQSLIRAHAERLLPHQDLFARVLPEAIAAQTELFRRMVGARHAARAAQHDFLMPRAGLEAPRPGAVSIEGIERIRNEFTGQSARGATWAIREHSPYAQALTLQPVRDMTVDDVVVLGGDRQLDIIGPPYIDTWLHVSGDREPIAYPDPFAFDVFDGVGVMGFDNMAQGGHDEFGAGLYIRFKPRIAPGFAQVRPYAPFEYEWFRTVITGREQNNAGLGIRVWSWDDGGGDLTTEQDYFYWVWRGAGDNAAGYDGNPSTTANPTHADSDFDTGFLYGSQAPYFGVRPNRVYVAAVWCFGECLAEGGAQGIGTGKLHVRLPWVVIGYQ